MAALYVLLAFLPVIVGGESGYHRYDLGCKCYPGYYVSTPCSPKRGADCTKCPHGKFSSKLDISTSCQDCSPCGINAMISTPCNPVNDTVCICPVGKVPRYYEEGEDFDCANSPKPPKTSTVSGTPQDETSTVNTPPPETSPVATPQPETSTDKPNPISGSNSHFLGVYQNRLMTVAGCIVGVYVKYILTFTSQ